MVAIATRDNNPSIAEDQHADAVEIVETMSQDHAEAAARAPGFGGRRGLEWYPPPSPIEGKPHSYTTIDTALWAVNVGLWPIPIRPIDSEFPNPGKAPIKKEWGVKYPTSSSLNWYINKFPNMNLGLLLGLPGGIVDVDVDVPNLAAPVLAAMFPDGLPPTLGWRNLGGKLHLLFRFDEWLARYGKAIIKGVKKGDRIIGNRHFLGLEVRIGDYTGEGKQHQTVIPPSLLVDGSARRWNERREILPIPDSMRAYLDQYATVADEPKEEPEPARNGKVIRINRTTNDDHERRYVLAAIDGEMATVAEMPEGDRNNGLNLAAYKLGGYIPSGASWGDEVATALLKAAQESGLPIDESQKTIQSGLNAGIAKPRKIPPPTGGHANGQGQGKKGGTVQHVEPHDVPNLRPEIELTIEHHIVTGQAIEALGFDENLFARGSSLVKVIDGVDEVETLPGGFELKNSAGAPKIVPLSESSVGLKLSENAKFFVWKVTEENPEGEAVFVSPPKWLIEAIAQHKHWPGVRELRGISEIPILRPDGSIVIDPGYDHLTQTLYRPRAVFPPMIENPTRDGALEAVNRILDLVDQFHFASDDDRVAWFGGS